METTRRLEWCALELTRDKGFDGWTMDDLAAAAEVSRRTVFNYFDGKADLVLGPMHETSDETAAAFVAGGPTGRLFDDLLHFAMLAVCGEGCRPRAGSPPADRVRSTTPGWSRSPTSGSSRSSVTRSS